MVKKNKQNNTSTLPKQLHQCWDFAHNSWTNRGISPVFSLSSFPQRAQYEVQHNTNISLLTFQSWEQQGVLFFFFVLLLSLSFFFMSSFEPKCWKYFKFNALLKPNPLFYTNTDVEKGVQLDEIGSERGE